MSNQNLTISRDNALFQSTRPRGARRSRLAFKTRELAEYAGRQFVELYADFVGTEVEKVMATEKGQRMF